MAATTAKEDNNAYFQINYRSIEGFSSLVNRKTAGLLCDFVLCSTLYTPPIFRKHSHHSIPLRSMVEQKHHVIASIDQVCFFYTSHQNLKSLLLVVELVAIPIESGSSFVLGWGSCAIDPDAETRSPTKVRIPLYEGSACILLTDELIKDETLLIDIPGCIVTVFLSSHSTLSKAVRFIPKNTLVAFDDIVPGLINTNVPEAFPKVLRCHPLSVEKLSLSLVPSVNIFECDFMDTLKEDLETQQIIIDERRVKFLPYNGWTIVSSPVVFHMTMTESRTVPGSSYCSSCLVFRGSLEIPLIPPHNLTEVIIQLEYVLKLDRQLKPGFPPSSDTVTVSLCWGVWKPFTDSMSSVNNRHEIELKQGPGYETTTIPNSAYNACYNNHNLRNIGRVTFVASSGPIGSKVNMSEQLSEVHVDLDQSNSSLNQFGIETADSGVTLDRDNEVLGQPQNMSTPRTRISSGTENVPIPSRIYITEQTLKTTGTNIWVEPVSRSLLALFYSSGVPELTSSDGDVLSYVNITNTPTMNNDRNLLIDHLLSKTVTIQLMGIEFLATPPHKALYSSVTPSAVTISYQFLHDAPTIANLHLVKLSSDDNLPFLLSLEKGGTLQVFKSSYFISSDIPDSENHRILNSFIRRGRITFSVFNYDSGIILGSATLPIKVLSSSLTDRNVHIPLCIPIIYNDTYEAFISTEPLSDGDSAVKVGLLYLSMGLSSSLIKPMTYPPQLLATPTRSAVAFPLSSKRLATGSRTRRLARMKVARDQCRFTTTCCDEICSLQDEKHSSISSVLLNSLSCSVSIVSQFGEVAYFEHSFSNKSSESVSVDIKCNSNDLCLVPSLDEVKLLRKHYNCKVADDPVVLSIDGTCTCSSQYKMFMAPNETIILPFKYTKHASSQGDDSNYGNQKERIEVKFHDSSRSNNDQLLSVLMVYVLVLYPTIDQVLYIYPSERIFMKKDISIPLSGIIQCIIHVQCTTYSVPCTCKYM